MSLPGFFIGTGMPDAEWWEALWPEPARLLAELGAAPDMVAIDLCCGDGWFTLPMARIVRRVIAIDLDVALLAAARRRLEAGGATNTCFIVGDAFDIAALAPEPADFIFLANAFHGVPDQPRLARAIRASLKPGGRLAIVNWQARPREETIVLGEPRGPATALRMPPAATRAVVEPAGFALEKLVAIAPYQSLRCSLRAARMSHAFTPP